MNTLKILAVDDDPATRELLRKRLSKAGYEIEIAKDGVEAVDLIAASLFDVIITDLVMPGEADGIDVLEAAKKKWDSTEVILITAHASVENAVEAMKKGAFDYLTKPLRLDELVLQLQKIDTLKLLAKDADDLREAMDVTEKGAAKTIQDLEVMLSDLRRICSEVKKILTQEDMQEHKRIKSALEVLSPGLH